jgi:hypothetical protein
MKTHVIVNCLHLHVKVFTLLHFMACDILEFHVHNMCEYVFEIHLHDIV